MKRFFALLVTAVLIISMFGVITAFAAGSASATFKGSTRVYAGKKYTYTIYAKLSGANSIMGGIKVSGVFEYVSGNKNFEYWASSNKTGSYKVGSITVKVKSYAKPGETGKIAVTGGSGAYLTADLDPVDINECGGSITAKVGTPSTTSTANTNKAPAAPAAPSEWDIAVTSALAMPEGGDLTVSITKDPKIPISLLNTVKEKQGALTVDLGDYKCAIDGKELGIMPKDAKTIDLSLKTDNDEKFSTAVGGKDAYQLHFTHSVQLPGKFSYKFKAENNKPSDKLYLYYYYSLSGVCEGVQSAAVDADGYVTFDIYHCSSYFVSESIIDGAAGVDFAVEAKTQPTVPETEGSDANIQAQLEDAQNLAAELQSELDTLKSEDKPANPLTASISGPAQNLFGVPYGSLISALLAAALVSMFLTMLIARVGVFKKRQRGRTDIE